MLSSRKSIDDKKSTLLSNNSIFQNQKNKVDYAIISAMPEELEFVTKEFANLKCAKTNVGGFIFNIYDYQNTKVIIAHSGMGTTFAASAFTLIHAYFKPEYFLIAGTAGGIQKNLELRDVVIAEKAFEAEIQDAFTLLKNTPFENCLKHPFKNQSFPAHYSADPELLGICESLNIGNINTYKGTIVSSNTFPAPKELFEKIKCLNPYSIDMETSAFYQTAWLLNAKVLAVRGISNILNPDGSDEKVHEADLKGSSIAAAKVIFSVLNKLINLKHQKNLIPIATINEEAQQLIEELNLQPHPEGGFFNAIYKSNDIVKPSDNERYNNESRSAGTSIYYLLNGADYSAWHVLKSDEIWHFYKGSSLYIHVIDKDGELKTSLLGDPKKTKGATFQVCIKAGNYFAAENVDKQSYSLVGCTVSPGFEYDDFKLCDKTELNQTFPQHAEIINKFCRSSIHTSIEDGNSQTTRLARNF
jgi:5'-methylthioadenosine/S-adenosylhomocysteine nucleosidase